MARKINEQKMMEDTALLHEERLKSPIRRYIDKSFISVTYYHIDAKRTTVDKGYQDVALLLGKDSPVKYEKILNLPLYDMEQIVLQLQMDDNVLDNGYEGTAVVMANTIIPLQNDFFTIPLLKDPYIFRVTAIENDQITSQSTYKISFVLEYINIEAYNKLESQTSEEYSCILENIGTDEKCIVKKSSNLRLGKIDEMYENITDTFMAFFYNERYNCFMGDFYNETKLYDPLQSEFIMKHHLFSKRRQINSLVLIELFHDPRRKLKYEQSIYRFMERRNASKIQEFRYSVFIGRANPETPFHRWMDNSVRILDIRRDLEEGGCWYQIIPDEMIEPIRNCEFVENSLWNFIIKFLSREPMDIYDIPLDIDDNLINLGGASLEAFFFTPIIMYIIRSLIREYLSEEKPVIG